VHALAPAPLSDEIVSKPVQEGFRRDVYEIFKTTIYDPLDDTIMPAEDDGSAPHSPYPVPLDPTLGRIELLREIANVGLDRPHYVKIVERLKELAMTQESEDDV
jgi:hypothetical protein